MENAIKKIIRKIKKGIFFDSHYIIDTLIKEYSDVYLRFAAGNLPRRVPGTTRFVHGRIAKLIPGSGLVDRAPNNISNSISYTIHNKANKCALWKRR